MHYHPSTKVIDFIIVTIIIKLIECWTSLRTPLICSAAVVAGSHPLLWFRVHIPCAVVPGSHPLLWVNITCCGFGFTYLVVVPGSHLLLWFRVHLPCCGSGFKSLAVVAGSHPPSLPAVLRDRSGVFSHYVLDCTVPKRNLWMEMFFCMEGNVYQSMKKCFSGC